MREALSYGHPPPQGGHFGMDALSQDALSQDALSQDAIGDVLPLISR